MSASHGNQILPWSVLMLPGFTTQIYNKWHVFMWEKTSNCEIGRNCTSSLCCSAGSKSLNQRNSFKVRDEHSVIHAAKLSEITLTERIPADIDVILKTNQKTSNPKHHSSSQLPHLGFHPKMAHRFRNKVLNLLFTTQSTCTAPRNYFITFTSYNIWRVSQTKKYSNSYQEV